MPRHTREKCKSGIYHVMIRGINRQDIFHDDEDYLRFLEILKQVKGIDNYRVYAYCLMSNHVHLLLHEKANEISGAMKRIGVSYAYWYNWKYDHVEHVFQDRFKSETINNDCQFLNVLRYIHNNPVKAEVIKEAEEYRWSSCRVYYGSKEYPAVLTDTDVILDLFGNNKITCINKLRIFTKEHNNEKFIEYEFKPRKSDKELQSEIISILGGEPVTIIGMMDKRERNRVLKAAKFIKGATQRQIARVTGINQSIISQA